MDLNTVLISVLLGISLYLVYQSMAVPLGEDASIKVAASGVGNPRLNGFAVSFNTKAQEGLIFANQPEANKYVAVYLKAGKPIVEAQVVENTPAQVAFGDLVVNDGKDHVIKVIWESGKVTASLDDDDFKEVALVSASQAFIYGKIQIGLGTGLTGLSTDANKQFLGCINYIKLPDSPLTSSNFKLGSGLTKNCSAVAPKF